MTAQEAAQKIKAYIIQQRGGVSFVELQSLLGDDAKGDLWMGQKEFNIWYWFDMSDLFIDALELLRPEIEPCQTHVLVYLCDGAYPAEMPIAKQVRRYKEPHWLPLAWNMRKEPLTQKGINTNAR